MLRYCENCKKDFEFAPLTVSGKDDLICPECGGIIGKNSRNPANRVDPDKTEEARDHLSTHRSGGRILLFRKNRRGMSRDTYSVSHKAFDQGYFLHAYI